MPAVTNYSKVADYIIFHYLHFDLQKLRDSTDFPAADKIKQEKKYDPHIFMKSHTGNKPKINIVFWQSCLNYL